MRGSFRFPFDMRRRLPTLLLLAIVGCGPTFGEAVQLMHDDTSADARREGMADLVTGFPQARTPAFAVGYHRAALNDPDPTVRAMAVRALNICRDASATPIFVAALADANEPVRLEGAKALANVPDRNAVPGLLTLLSGDRPGVTASRFAPPGSEGVENRDVRIAAADALRRYPTLDVEHALIGVLNGPDFGLAWQARQSLITLTGQDLQYDAGAWLRFLVGT